ncbi:hypothetical protein Tco_1111499 [Tanacetum coccineum]|uniref:Retrovirus-related Pol polyprotein from transposon TNT 1-94-like beta-barrel domain-containing protein n=1 Tax=Tanacetum coccineum TaxID=301880 RepID=A0ABQ5IN28_9ASTR
MTTLAEHIIIVGAENHPPMHEKSMYDSWASRIRLFIKGKKHGRMMLDSINNGPLVYPTVEENGLYNLFDKFAHVPGETLYEYYWRFSQLINDIHTIGMTMQQVQVNTKFLNALPLEWSKFFTYVKLAKSFLVVPMFQQREDLNECINKAMAFLSVVASRFLPSNNQLRTSSNPRNQATIQYGRVTVQQVKRRQNQSYAGTGNKGIATTSKGNVVAGQPRVVKCYNYQGEGHMARQCTQPKRTRNVAWFKEKLMLAEAQEAGQILDEEQLAFLADPAKAVLMGNLSSCDPEVLSEVVQIVLWYLDSECSKHMTRNRSQLMNFVSKFLGTVQFINDQVAKIIGYGDYQQGTIIISRVYYVEEGVDLLSGSRDTNLYTTSLYDMLKTSLICLLSKASKTKSWFRHRHLSHLNFACALGKSKKSSHQPKAEDTNQEKLYLLHMDLCGPMRVESINEE